MHGLDLARTSPTSRSAGHAAPSSRPGEGASSDVDFDFDGAADIPDIPTRRQQVTGLEGGSWDKPIPARFISDLATETADAAVASPRLLTAAKMLHMQKKRRYKAATADGSSAVNNGNDDNDDSYSDISSFVGIPMPSSPAHLRPMSRDANYRGNPPPSPTYSHAPYSPPDPLWKEKRMHDHYHHNSNNSPGGHASYAPLASTHTHTPDSTAVTLPALQTTGMRESDAMQPLVADEMMDPASFDLVAPADCAAAKLHSLERRSELLFSGNHLQAIFADQALLQRFTMFLHMSRPSSVPLLLYYLDTLKALRAIDYSNAILDELETIGDHAFTSTRVAATANRLLEARSRTAFDEMVRNDLPAYITSVWQQIVHMSVKSRITGTLPPHLIGLSEGLAEVFCLTDPSRPDNPIVFASEEFHRTTQYGINHAIGRNCRFLQGPKTNRNSVRRIRQRLDAGKDSCETFLNYRRDGSPFMNLLMVAPLYDSRGMIRYFIGAQVDVSGLAKECSGLDAFRRLVDEEEDGEHAEKSSSSTNNATHGVNDTTSPKDEFRSLAEMLTPMEMLTINSHGGTMHLAHKADPLESAVSRTNRRHSHRIIIEDGAQISEIGAAAAGAAAADPSSSLGSLSPLCLPPSNGKLAGVYEHYLLVRPYPSLRILFASQSLRLPGVLQSPFMSKIGGSERVRRNLERALAEGRGVTARVLWTTRAGSARSRWIHCTPLLGHEGKLGVWMVILVDDSEGGMVAHASGARKEGPPIEYGSRAARACGTAMR